MLFLKFLVFFMLMTNQITLSGVLLLMMALWVILNFTSSFLSYLVVLVYISGVLLLLLYLTTLTANTRSFSIWISWLLVLLPGFWLLKDIDGFMFSFFLLLSYLMKLALLLMLLFLVFILLLVSYFVSFQKKSLKW